MCCNLIVQIFRLCHTNDLCGEVFLIRFQPYRYGTVCGLFCNVLELCTVTAAFCQSDYVAFLDTIRRNIHMLAVYGKVTVCYQLSCFSAGQSETHAEYNAVQTGFQTSDQVVTSLAFHLACDFEQVEELLFAYTVDELQLLLFLKLHSILRNFLSVVSVCVSECKEHGTVEFKNVSFRYPHTSEDELSNISFRVNRGETLAVIGATGSGKTTLVSLIPRFYDATEGEVLVDGVNVRDYTFDTLYNKLGYVTQKAVLFAGSIRDNVYFGESEAPADDEGLAQTVELSQAKEFVDKLPDGTQHHVAQMGRNMSGGQKQRLSIARALARKPEILVFDDSFSALDYRTDAKLREGLSKQLHDTTKIIVAQRISTIRHADKIIVLDRGETVGIGTHEELMKNCDVYREIATSQLSAAELA